MRKGLGMRNLQLAHIVKRRRFSKKVLDVEYNVKCNVLDKKTKLLEKANHLGEIHKAPRECWVVLVELLLTKLESDRKNETDYFSGTFSAKFLLSHLGQ